MLICTRTVGEDCIAWGTNFDCLPWCDCLVDDGDDNGDDNDGM